MRFFDFLKGPDINQGVKEYSTTDGAVLLDVRTPDEYRQGHIPGSKNVPLQSISKVAGMIDNKSTPIFVHCLSGARSRQAAAILKQMGYTNVKNSRFHVNMKVRHEVTAIHPEKKRSYREKSGNR